MKPQNSLNKYIQNSVRENWNSTAFTNFQANSYLYSDVAKTIKKIHILYSGLDIKPGDKIAFCGKNSAEWATIVIATITYGAVAVPILNDFKPDNIHHLVNHCDARLFFTDKGTWKGLDPNELNNVDGVILINDLSVVLSHNDNLAPLISNLDNKLNEQYPAGLKPEDIEYYNEQPDDLMLINYTSGSMGFSKGVMISYRSLWSNIQFSIDHMSFLLPGDNMLSMLPLAHMYGLMVELLHPFVKGCHTYFLNRTPSPAILLAAFAEVKPKLIVAVPLILEKIVKSKIFPALEKPAIKRMLKFCLLRKYIYNKIRTQLIQAFGGNLIELIIGGAALNKDVETLLRAIKFPYTVGYGMTECAPLIAYAPWQIAKPSSCGQLVDRMELKIDSSDPHTIPGTLYVKGDNVMKGYYKNEEATNEAIDKDGWMNTGDVCTVDEDGFITIRGRNKSMILGPSGQNIYPEEIEQKLNNCDLVVESIVVSREHRLYALLNLDNDAIKARQLSKDDVKSIITAEIAAVNNALPGYSKLSNFEIHEEEFEKTPKRSIKRYLYK
jgi:long-chain acyl-CoA synthetase